MNSSRIRLVQIGGGSPRIHVGEGALPSVTVSFNLAPGVSLSDAAQEIAEMQNRLGMPETIRGFFAGTLRAYQQSLSPRPHP